MDIRRLSTLVLTLLLCACAARPSAVVVERSLDNRPPPAASRQAVPAEYVVRRGDTLYGIAFRHGVDFRALARSNGIVEPFTIYPGQRLRLDRPAPATAATAAAPSAPARTTTRPERPPPPPLPTGGVTSPEAPVRPQASTPATATRPSAPATPAVAGTGPVIWRWPTEGQILATFSAGDPTRQGIDIVGSGGQPVRAAADGEVVYSGAGLVGYGELIIIKHSDAWLSAYGHNRKRLVTEGQRVTGGQQIAEMGRSGASRDMLHFEIRRNGRPTDPLPLLPRR